MFFELIHRYVITDERFFRGFEVFWGVSWFAITKGRHHSALIRQSTD